jgi:hypothetical protein
MFKNIKIKIYKTVIFFVLYGNEKFSLPEKEHDDREEVTSWRKLHDEEFHNLYSS